MRVGRSASLCEGLFERKVSVGWLGRNPSRASSAAPWIAVNQHDALEKLSNGLFDVFYCNPRYYGVDQF